LIDDPVVIIQGNIQPVLVRDFEKSIVYFSPDAFYGVLICAPVSDFVPGYTVHNS
jgi:hypothetical protein